MATLLDTPLTGTAIGDVSLGAYLATLLATLWEQEEDFSGKRPFGNSSWKIVVYEGLVRAGHIQGRLDADGYLEECDKEHADRLILHAIRNVFGIATPGPAGGGNE